MGRNNGLDAAAKPCATASSVREREGESGSTHTRACPAPPPPPPPPPPPRTPPPPPHPRPAPPTPALHRRTPPPVQLVLGDVEERLVVTGPGDVTGSVGDRLCQQLAPGRQVPHPQRELFIAGGVLAPGQQPAGGGGEGRSEESQGGQQGRRALCTPRDAWGTLCCKPASAAAAPRTCGRARPRSRTPCRRSAAWPPRSHPAAPPLRTHTHEHTCMQRNKHGSTPGGCSAGSFWTKGTEVRGGWTSKGRLNEGIRCNGEARTHPAARCP